MFCWKCGEKIADEALICPRCGCATPNYQAPVAAAPTHSQDYILIKDFEDTVKSMYTASIFALVLFLGIGLPFSFFVWFKARTLFVPLVTTEDPSEIAMLNSAKKKLKTAINFATLPVAGPVILVFALLLAGQIVAAVCTMAVLLLIMFLVGIPCTWHLKDDLY